MTNTVSGQIKSESLLGWFLEKMDKSDFVSAFFKAVCYFSKNNNEIWLPYEICHHYERHWKAYLDWDEENLEKDLAEFRKLCELIRLNAIVQDRKKLTDLSADMVNKGELGELGDKDIDTIAFEILYYRQRYLEPFKVRRDSGESINERLDKKLEEAYSRVGGRSPKTAYRLINRAQRLYELYKWEETGKRINEAIIQLAACWIVSRRAVKCSLVREDFISELEGGK